MKFCTSCVSIETPMKLSQNQRLFLRVLITRGCTILGLTLGSPYIGTLPYVDYLGSDITSSYALSPLQHRLSDENAKHDTQLVHLAIAYALGLELVLDP